jgi:hypothetical protein
LNKKENNSFSSVFESKKDKNRFFSYSDVFELKNRGLLFLKSQNNEKPEELNLIQGFINLTDKVSNIINAMNELENFGFPNDQLSTQSFICNHGKYSELETFDTKICAVEEN